MEVLFQKGSVKMKKNIIIALFLISNTALYAGFTFSFDAGSDNNSGVAQQLAGQFSIDFESDGSDMVYAKFNFADGDFDAKITEIIFDNSSDFFESAQFISGGSSDGVLFYSTDNPSAPQWNDYYDENFSKDVTDYYAFNTKDSKSADYSILSKNNKFKGLSSGQFFTIGFKIKNEINELLLKSKLKIGFHAQSIIPSDDPKHEYDFSDSFFKTCNSPTPVVPAPGAMLLAALGTGTITVFKRKIF